MNRWLILAIAMACIAGCAAPAVHLPSSEQHLPQVLLFRGFTGNWSHGLDRLAGSLRDKQIPVAIYAHSDWPQVASAIEKSRRDGPLILIGHSWGADDAIRLARRLESSGIDIRLLITLDPVTPPRIPGNVNWTINFYESNGIRDMLPWWRGVAISADRSTTRLMNIDVRHQRLDLEATDVTHGTITDSAGIQGEILRRIAESSKADRAQITY